LQTVEIPVGRRVSGSILVVGGTAILRPAVHTLCAGNHDVAVLSRSREHLRSLAAEVSLHRTPGTMIALQGDFTHEVEFAELLTAKTADRGPFAAGVIYAPDAPATALDAMARAVTGRLVVILTSRYGAPDRPAGRQGYPAPFVRDDLQVNFLLLGWHGAAGSARWHSPAEISAAALEALIHGHDATLGSTHPWEDRPQ
jgi:hypothetical protein